jgi:hypothetical protein
VCAIRNFLNSSAELTNPFVMHAYLGGIARENAMVTIADCRLSSAGAEHQVNQARYVTMRHENQPSLTGLVFLVHCTQHWFGAVPSFSSCTACMRRTVLGYSQVVPAGLCARNSCRNSGAGKDAPRTELCDLDPALDQQPGKAGTNVETPGYGLQAVRNCCVMNPALEAAEDCYPSRNRCFPQLLYRFQTAPPLVRR